MKPMLIRERLYSHNNFTYKSSESKSKLDDYLENVNT